MRIRTIELTRTGSWMDAPVRGSGEMAGRGSNGTFTHPLQANPRGWGSACGRGFILDVTRAGDWFVLTNLRKNLAIDDKFDRN